MEKIVTDNKLLPTRFFFPCRWKLTPVATHLAKSQVIQFAFAPLGIILPNSETKSVGQVGKFQPTLQTVGLKSTVRDLLVDLLGKLYLNFDFGK